MEGLLPVLSLLCTLGFWCASAPYGKAIAVVVFNASLPPMEFVVPGKDFYDNKLKWNETKQVEFKNLSMAYFQEKFGFVNPEFNDSLNTMLYSTNPQVNTRCVTLTAENVPLAGYPLYDGGWMITVTNPAGITLGGEFKGKHVPMGTTFAIGQWLIERPDNSTILWEFQHTAPGIRATPDEGRLSSGEMAVQSEAWGTGVSLQVTRYTINHNASIADALFRNVITF